MQVRGAPQSGEPRDGDRGEADAPVPGLVAVLVFFRGGPSGEKLASAPWWVWIGDVLGAFYVLGSVVTAPKLGAATLVALILAGQAAASLTVDHFGLVGFTENPVTPGRLVGIGLVALGVVLVRVF